jgi:hypothetical protein
MDLRARPVITAAVLAGLLLATAPAVGSASPGGGTLSADLNRAATAHRVPVDLLTAIGWTQTHLAMQVSRAGRVGPMGLSAAPPNANLAEAADLSRETPAAVSTTVAANLDAGAAWLRHQAGDAGGSDLRSWRPAVGLLLGEPAAAEVYAALAAGISGVTAGGEPVSVAARPALAAAAFPSAAATPSPDYPPATWVPADPNNYEGHERPAEPDTRMVVIHVSQGSYAGTIAYFQNPAANASSHYVARSADGALTQVVRDHDVAFHAGNWAYNLASIGIEHEGYVNDPSWFTEAMYQASARLVAEVVRRYDIPVDRQHIIGHNEVPDPDHQGQFGGRDHHTDPGPYWNWSHYMALVTQYAACPAVGAPPPVPTTPPGTNLAAVVGSDCALWVHRGGTPGFVSLGGRLAAAPAVTATAPGIGPLYVVTGLDHDLWIRSEAGGWRQLSGSGAVYCIDNPAAIVASGRFTVACQGRDHGLWTASAAVQPGVIPEVVNWRSLGGALGAGPAVGMVAGRLEFDAVTGDGQVDRWTEAAPAWIATTWRCYGHPALATTGRVATFACHGRDGALYYATNGGSGWSPATSLGGLVGNGVGIAAGFAGPTFFAEGIDGGLYERGLTGGWVPDGGRLAFGTAAAVA